MSTAHSSPTTVVPCIATLICSRINVAIRIRRYAGGNPLECIKLHLMHSYGAKTHRYAKIPPSGRHFRHPVSEGRARKWSGWPFFSSGSHFGTANQLLLEHHNAKIGKQNAYRSSQCDVLPFKTSQCDRISDRKKRVAMRIHC